MAPATPADWKKGKPVVQNKPSLFFILCSLFAIAEFSPLTRAIVPEV
jgi:hypothetical protein